MLVHHLVVELARRATNDSVPTEADVDRTLAESFYFPFGGRVPATNLCESARRRVKAYLRRHGAALRRTVQPEVPFEVPWPTRGSAAASASCRVPRVGERGGSSSSTPRPPRTGRPRRSARTIFASTPRPPSGWVSRRFGWLTRTSTRRTADNPKCRTMLARGRSSRSASRDGWPTSLQGPSRQPRIGGDARGAPSSPSAVMPLRNRVRRRGGPGGTQY
jgi:hypothetical protein